MWSLGKAAHRIEKKSIDDSRLGRWIWVRYKGRNNVHLPMLSISGPHTVCAQHWTYFNSINKDRCLRAAFLQDLFTDITEALTQGDNIIVLLDGNKACNKVIYTKLFLTVISMKH
jgi:hypothetical protein